MFKLYIDEDSMNHDLVHALRAHGTMVMLKMRAWAATRRSSTQFRSGKKAKGAKLNDET